MKTKGSRAEKKEQSVHRRLDSLESGLRNLRKQHDRGLASMSTTGYQVLIENMALRSLLFRSPFLRWVLRITQKKFERQMKRVKRYIEMNQRLERELERAIKRNTDGPGKKEEPSPPNQENECGSESGK